MKILYSLFCINFIYIQLTLAQVTIGNQEPPTQGALLQLKNIEGVTNGASNATKGLGLPRVGLVNKNSLAPLADNTNSSSYTGALVYNVTEPLVEPTSACDPTPVSLGMSVGLKVWSGSQWEDLSSSETDLTIPPDWISSDVRFIKDHEGNIYPVRKFADEGYWMLENLRTETFPNGRAKYPVKIGTSFKTDSYSAVLAVAEARYQYPSPPLENKPYYGDEVYPPITDDSFFKKYPNEGLLYNYFMSLNGEEPQFTTETNIDGVDWVSPRTEANGRPNSFIQGICPEGWHIPYSQEYKSLFTYITNEFNVGNGNTSGVDMDFQSQNNITIPRLPLTNCLPDGRDSNTRGASKIALKGGLAAMWIGADSPYPSVQGGANDKTGPKEYGILCVFATASDSKHKQTGALPVNVMQDWVANVSIRPHSLDATGVKGWEYNKSHLTNMYPVRCKKDDASDSGILNYEDIYKK